MNHKPLVINQADCVWQTRDAHKTENGPAVRWKTLISSDITASDSLTMGYSEIMPGAKFSRHRHAQPEVYYILEGSGSVEIEGQSYPVQPGTAVFLPGNALHTLINTGAGPLRLVYTFPVDSFADVEYILEQR